MELGLTPTGRSGHPQVLLADTNCGQDAEREHAAVGVVDQNDLFGPEQVLRDRQRTNLVVGDHASSVADDVGVTLVQAQSLGGVQAGIHAGPIATFEKLAQPLESKTSLSGAQARALLGVAFFALSVV